MPIKGIPQGMPIYPKLEDDGFGQRFLEELEALCGPPRLVTDAPWFVRVRAWRPQGVDAVVIHWINYQQDEEAVIEIPLPVGPLRAECQIPDGSEVERVECYTCGPQEEDEDAGQRPDHHPPVRVALSH